MTTLCPYVFFQEFDNNGQPLVGGKVFTYEAGTTTPKPTYTDSTGAVANTNPVILNSAGRADIWFEDGGYKLVLTTAADVVVKTVDNVGGVTGTAFGANVQEISSNTVVNSTFANSALICTAALTLSLLAANEAGEGFYIIVKNQSTGNVIIDPDTSETIDNASTLTIKAGYSAVIITDGVEWYSAFLTPEKFDTIQALGSAGISFNNNTGGNVLTIGAGGGTGATFAGGLNVTGALGITGIGTFSNAVNTAKGADIASATTTNLGTATGNFVHITGTTTITGFGTVAAGVFRLVRFAGVLTLTHNATSLILPTGANITTAANDTAIFVSEGSGNWRCVNYSRATGSALANARFISTAQTITPAGSLTLAHGLGSNPVEFGAYLTCTTADLNYPIGARVPYYPMAQGNVSATSNSGVSINSDATNLNVRFGQSVSPSTIFINDATTGVLSGITNSSWTITFIARV